MEPQVTIFLTTPEAELFKSYQEFHKTFALLVKSGAFDTKNGTVEINFNENGEIGSITKKEMIFRISKKSISD